jgi:type 1 fimbria pilin
MNFNGQVLGGGTCNLSAESKNMIVPLEDVASSDFKIQGSTGPKTTFSLMIECAQRNFVGVSFEGQSTNDPTIFGLDSQMSAKGVGLQITNPVNGNNYIQSNSSTPTFYYLIEKDKKVEADYTAYYISYTPRVTQGDANVTLQLNLTYL